MGRLTEPLVVNHGELYSVSGCGSCNVLQRHWLWFIVRYAETVVVNHGELC
jgi:hypothetical protein